MAPEAQHPQNDGAASSPAPRGAGAPPVELVEERVETVDLRRAPKITVFLIAGAALGIVLAMILTFAFHGSDAPSPNTSIVYSTGQVFGFLALICGVAGLAIGGIVALILDRTVGRRTRRVTVDRETVTSVD
jgi:hypothetical protein